MEKKYTKTVHVAKQVSFGIIRTAVMALMGLFIGMVIGGNLASPNININFHYAGTYGYEAAGILGVQIGLVLGIVLSIYFGIQKSRKIYFKNTSIIVKILFGLFLVGFMYTLGGMVAAAITKSNEYVDIGAKIGTTFGILLGFWFAYWQPGCSNTSAKHLHILKQIALGGLLTALLYVTGTLISWMIGGVYAPGHIGGTLGIILGVIVSILLYNKKPQRKVLD